MNYPNVDANILKEDAHRTFVLEIRNMFDPAKITAILSKADRDVSSSDLDNSPVIMLGNSLDDLSQVSYASFSASGFIETMSKVLDAEDAIGSQPRSITPVEGLEAAFRRLQVAEKNETNKWEAPRWRPRPEPTSPTLSPTSSRFAYKASLSSNSPPFRTSNLLPELLRETWKSANTKRLEIVYVLRCKNDKYYVGKTESSRLNVRIGEHLSGDSWWTKQNPPLELVEKVPCEGFPFAEMAMTYHYMNMHGMDNVRGAQHCGYLDDWQTNQIQRALRHENNVCLGCGSPDHWISKCPYEKHEKSGSTNRDVAPCAPVAKYVEKKGKEEVIGSSVATTTTTTTTTTETNKEGRNFIKKEGSCFKCGAQGHWAKECHLPRQSYRTGGTSKTFVKKK
jgi:predicted GIY-YIG superfamily endonuclease